MGRGGRQDDQVFGELQVRTEIVNIKVAPN